jgi:hypothetical protein
MCGNAIKFPSETNGNSTYCGDEVYKYWSVFTQGRCFFLSGYIRSGPYFSNIWIHFFKIAYLSNGCYSVNNCGGSTSYGNVFVESLTQSQCNQSASLFYTATCWKGCSYNQIQSTNMNVETCLQVCNKYGYTYAGLTTYILMFSFLN